jgi:hypothetical protein
MISSSLISARVECEGAGVGYVGDLRIEDDGDLVVVGVIVAPRVWSSFLGYERTGMAVPWLIKALLMFLNRGSFVVDWDDVVRFDEDNSVLNLSPGYQRRDVTLDGDRA